MRQQPESGADRAARLLGVQRSQWWDRVRRTHLEIKNPNYDQSCCAVCNGTDKPQVHHIVPFHFCHLVYRGDLELDERNLMTLCEVPEHNHHELLGHLGDWEIYNKAGREGIAGAFKGKPASDLTADQIQLAEVWTQWMGDKPHRWNGMSANDRFALRQFLDANLPYIPTDDFSGPQYPYVFDNADDPDKKATTYGEESRWKMYQSQAAKAASDIASQ